jgi:hypothetical protein
MPINRFDNSATFFRVLWDLLRDTLLLLLLLEQGLGKSRQDATWIIRRVILGLKYSADGRLGAQLEISLCAQKLYIASQ